MHLLIITDAWHPQVNGVVRSYENVIPYLERRGHRVSVISPQDFTTIPLPYYPEIRLALTLPFIIGKKIHELRPDFLHIATEGPLGWMARGYARKYKLPFTTSYHTRFPEYVEARLPIPTALSYAVLRRFHNAGGGVMVATDSLEEELRHRGFQNILRWGRGVDISLFTPDIQTSLDLPRPIHLYVGRVAVEKNLQAFLSLPLQGSKVIVGDGPQREALEVKFPDAYFLGKKIGKDLAAIYAAADVFVFPSLTDTFGVVLIEALASGLPIAAYPVTGPKDIVEQGVTGVLNTDLGVAIEGALQLSKEACREAAKGFTWEKSALQFEENIQTVHRLQLKERRRRRLWKRMK